MRRGRRVTIASVSAVIAISAAAGAIGLATGGLDSSPFVARLPWHSPVLAGLALAVVVALPAGISTFDPHPRPARATGALLCAWIVVELAVIREISWLQPVCFAAGVALLALGSPGSRVRRSRARAPISRAARSTLPKGRVHSSRS